MKNILFYGLLALTISMSAQRNRLKNIYSENGKIGIMWEEETRLDGGG